MRDNVKLAMLQSIIEEYEKAALRKASRSAIMVTLNGPLSAMDRMTDSARSVVNSEPSDYSMEDDEDSDLSLRDVYNGFGDTAEGSWLEECLNCNLRPLEAWQLAPLEWLTPLQDLLEQINMAIDNIEAAIDDVGPISQICLLLEGMNGLTCPQDILIMIQALTMLFRLRAGNLLKIRLDWTAVLGPLLSVIFDAVGNILGWVETLVFGILDCMLGAIGTLGSIQQEVGEAYGVLDAYVGRPKSNEGGGSDRTPEFYSGAAFEEEPLYPWNSDEAYTDPVYGESRVIYNTLSRVDGSSSVNIGEAGRVDTTGFLSGKQSSLETQGSSFASKVTTAKIGNTEDLEGIDEMRNTSFFNSSTLGYSDESGLSSERDFTVPFTGLEVSADMTIDQAIALPKWASASWSIQLEVALRTARRDVAGFIKNLKISIHSLKKLVSGGIAAQIQATQTLLYLTSLIKLLVAVFKIIKSMPDRKNWCEQVEKDPSSIAPFLQEQFPEYKFEAVEPEPAASVDSYPKPGLIRVIHESAQVANIQGCSSKRNGADRDRMNQWINRLQKMGVV